MLSTNGSCRVNWLRKWWERLIAVDHPDEDMQRLGRVFNILLVGMFAIVIVLFLTFMVDGTLGLMPYPDYWISALFPLGFIPFSGYCFYRVKHGKIESTVQIFAWGAYLGVALACLLFDDVLSAGWVLFFWPIGVAGILAQASYALWLSAGTVGYYLLMLLAKVVFGFESPFTSGDARLINFAVFSLLMLVVSGGAVNFLNMRSLQQALKALRKTTQDLAQARQGLERRVEMRTSQLRARAEQFQSIAELNRELAGVFELDELLNTAVHFIARRLDFYHVGIFFLDDTGKWMQLRAASSEAGKKMVDQGHKLAVGKESLVGRTAATARAQVVGDVERTTMWYANPNLPETHSEMVLPLVVRGDLIGALDIQSETKQAFSEEDVQTLSVLADGLAVFIENTRLITQTRHTLERLRHYQEEEVVSGWRQALRRRHRDITYAYDRVQMLEETPDALDLPGEMADLEGVKVAQRDDGAHVLMAPVRIRQRALGIMLFESRDPWSDDARRLAADVTEQLGLALENARLLEETRFRATQERARSEIVGRVRASVQVDAILRSAAQELGRALQVERTRLQLVTPERDDAASKSGDGR